jgi:hypothetical protein
VHISSLLLCYRLLRTVYCIYSNLLRYRLTPQYRVDYCTSLRQCHLTLLSQLLLSLKLLSELHSCRSLIVRAKRYSYRFVLQSFQPIDIIRLYRAHCHVLYQLALSQYWHCQESGASTWLPGGSASEPLVRKVCSHKNLWSLWNRWMAVHLGIHQ